jgi:hypothetical protein
VRPVWKRQAAQNDVCGPRPTTGVAWAGVRAGGQAAVGLWAVAAACRRVPEPTMGGYACI